MTHTILVVDDDKKTVDLIRVYLEHDHYQVYVAYDGKQALEVLREHHPHLIILDWMLPYIDGLDVCQIVHRQQQLPIIMLTAKASEEHKLLGLGRGADDYLTKPFSPRELVARVRVVLRRCYPPTADEPKDELCLGDLKIDFLSHEVRLQEKRIELTPREFKLLETLTRTPGRVFSRQELVDRVLGQDYEGGERTIDVHMMNLRKKIEPQPNDPIYLQTIYGVGYKFRRAHDVS
jgi:DNA-binding response OmpR family regulator